MPWALKNCPASLRRSIAALLSDKFSLAAVPRNLDKPGHFSNYALSKADDQQVTGWMCDRLAIAVWVWDRSRPLAAIETDVLSLLNPPLNLTGVQHPWKANLQHRRKAMAAQAERWRPPAGGV